MAAKSNTLRLSKLTYSIKRGTVNAICYFIDIVLFLFIKRKEPHNINKNVLLIRPDAIGDFIVWSASAKAYREIYPSNLFNIVLLGNGACKDLAMKMGIFDLFLPFDRKKFMLNFSYRLDKWQELTSINFHTIIYPAYSREFATGDLLIKRLKAVNKIGICSDNAIDDKFWHKLINKAFTKLYDLPNVHSHELIKNQAFIATLANRDFEVLPPNLSFLNTGEAIFLKFEHDNIKESVAQYYVIFPGARIAIRQWSGANFAAIVDYIYEKTGWQGILLGSTSEYAICEKVKASSKSPIHNLAGKTNLIEMIQLIGKAQLFVGNETSGIHIAIAQNTPSVCVLGGGHFGRFMPYPQDLLSKSNVISSVAFHQMACFNCDWNCIYQTGKNKAVPCIENVEVENVKKEIEKIFKLRLSPNSLSE